MSITDELREWAHARFVGLLSSEWEREVDEIADRIDEQHRRALEKVAAAVDEDAARGEYTRGYNSGYDVAIDALDELTRRVSAIERKLNHRGDR